MNGNQTIGKFFSLKLRSLPICVPLSTAYDKNKLAKARKTRKWPGTLGLKQFGPGKLRIKNVWSQNIFIDFIDQA